MAVGFLDANRMPLRAHENILVFYDKLPTYNPQKEYGHKPYKGKQSAQSTNYRVFQSGTKTDCKDGSRYPRDVIKFSNADMRKGVHFHPTQKPTDLLEYLIKTYTNEGETVMDTCMGSGSTGVAAVNTNRNFIGFELEEGYFTIAEERIKGGVGKWQR